MSRWFWGPVLAAAAGCNGISQTTCKRVMWPLMSDVQRAEYLKQPTWPERKAYLFEIGQLQKLESAPPAIRQAILDQRVIEGMNPDQVMMTWGRPVVRQVIKPSDDPKAAEREGRKERWLFAPRWTSELEVRYLREVEFTNDVVLHVRDDRRKRTGR